MYSSGVTALLIIIFLPGQSTCKRTAYLYYSSQGQAGGRPGLYVSGVDESGDVSGSTTLTGTRRFDTDCNNATTDPQWLRSLSFDDARGRLLMMTGRKQHDDDSGFSLTLAPVCHECADNGTDIRMYFVDARISPTQFKIYGFLMNDRRIYFIGERKQQIDTYSTKHIIQLRRLTLGGRCGRLFPVTSTDPFDIDSCSRLIAVVSSETYTSFPRYQPLEGLLAVPAADGSAVDIYLQLQHLTYNSSGGGRPSEVAIELYHVRYQPGTTSDDDADLQTVVSDAENEEQSSDERPAPAKALPIYKAIPSPEAIRYSLTNRGGLSTKDGWMCWSTVDRVLCGRLTSSGSVTEVKTLLHHDAVAGNICHGSNVLANVITGVALVKAADEISFYFGCVAQATGMGGAGLFVGSHDDASARRVYQLHGNDNATIRAGAVFRGDSDVCDVAAIWQRITGRNFAVCLVSPCWSVIAIASVLLLRTTSIKSC